MGIDAYTQMASELNNSVDQLYVYVKVFSIFIPVLLGLIIYIWNRSVKQQDATSNNLEKLIIEFTKVASAVEYIIKENNVRDNEMKEVNTLINEIKINCVSNKHKKTA